MEDDSLFTVKEYAALLKLSESTVYRNPAKYHMFRVGRSWRASKESLKRFEQAQFQDDVCSSIGSRIKSNNPANRSFNAVMSQVEAEIEFERRLAGRKRQ
ncbi:helix-turn-helix domain-containing protein [Providencia hangzhouensis]|uniref:helix-turn-helix domain-containing protein n=1 Tax=Providencia hangzhouensis TaxID=3031799 RepID=UPI003F49F55E